MQVSVENTGELGRRMKITVPAGEIDQTVHSRIHELGSQVRMNGFRPGRVPYKVLQQRFGGRLRQEVMNEVMQNSFREALTEHQMRPIGTPEITADRAEAGQDFKYSVEFEVMPQVDDLDLGAIEVTRLTAQVADKDIEGMVQTLRQQRQSWKEISAPAAKDHLVVFEYRDASQEPGEEAARSGGVLGAGVLGTSLEKALKGMSAGEEKTAKVTFPEHFQDPDLAGKKAEINIKVVTVSEAELPEVDADFIRSFGCESGDLEDFKKDVAANLERELRQAVNGRNKQNVVDALVAACPDISLPKVFLDAETQRLEKQAGESLDEDTKAKIVEAAHRRVAGAVLIGEVARQYKVVPDEDKIRTAINDVASTYDDPEQVLDMYRKNREAMEQVQNNVVEEQVVDVVFQHAKLVDEESSLDALLRGDAAK